MRRQLVVALSAATVVAALGLSGCSHSEHGSAPSSSAAASSSVASTAVAPNPAPTPQTPPLPPAQALTDVLYRLADPAVPGNQKLDLVESATPDNAAALEKFATALVDGGYAPVTFNATDIAWSDKDPADVVATVNVTSPNRDAPGFSFPMEFKPYPGGWQLSHQTVDVLLGDVRSLKQKRSVIRPLVAELQRKLSVSAAETGSHDLYRRAGIGVALVSGDRGHTVEVLDAAERLVAAHPEFELLSVRRGLQRSDDD